MWALLVWLWFRIHAALTGRFFPRRTRFRRRLARKNFSPRRSRTKPPWVVQEILRLKALMPEAGCRAIAALFNRRFAAKGISVSKTFVSDKLRAHHLEILRLRKDIRRRQPKASLPNRIWALDLTGKTDSTGQCHSVLALIDHGTRANLRLVALPDKRSVTVLKELVEAIRCFGRPRYLRTDNEAIFTSRFFTLALRRLGINHQTTDLGCPWQNGRVERFFGTLKSKLIRLAVDSLAELNGALAHFRLWYNHIRPHHALDGRTPAEVWAGETALPRFRQALWFEAWEGLLQGYYLRP